RLGLGDGTRVVLYAPTLRDHLADRRGRYALDLQLDLDRVRDAAGADTVLLVRKHPYVDQDVAPGSDTLIRDVSAYPDATELLLITDVLITDYSSVMADFACTGRPMLFFAYDLEAYREEVRGFYVDYEATVPGPVLRRSDEVAEALRNIDGIGARHAERYA